MIERTHANATRLTTLDDTGTTNPGYDQLGRLVKMRHLHATTLIAGFGYGYNRESVKTYREDLRYPQLSELYHYDSLYRIIDFQRGTLSASKDAITGTPTTNQTWQLDGVGNWANTVVDGETKTQTINKMNEYQRFAGKKQVYDDNGNLTDDGTYLYAYDFNNRLRQITDKANNRRVATYTYDAQNRRITKQVPQARPGSEYSADANTLALFHCELANNTLVDAGGQLAAVDATGIAQPTAGVFANAARFSGLGLKLPKNDVLENYTNQITVETWLYIDSPEVNGVLVRKGGSYNLKIVGNGHKLRFVVFIEGQESKFVTSNHGLPLGRWVHVAGVYDGSEVALYVDGIKQNDVLTITGNLIKDPSKRVVLGDGSAQFHGIMDEIRISNIARTSFPALSRQVVESDFYYDGWDCIEEREKTALEGSGVFGAERITRQFVDGANIDEHICVDYYTADGSAIERTYFYHANTRGDIVALTDANAAVVLEMRYAAYGAAAKVDAQGNLLEFHDFSLVVFSFQSRRVDSESSLIFFRHRQYNPVTGRFCQRDPEGYIDSYNLYGSFGNNPINFRDYYGLYSSNEPEKIAKYFQILRKLNEDAGYIISKENFTKILSKLKKVDLEISASVSEKSAAYKGKGILVIRQEGVEGILTLFHELIHAKQDLLDGGIAYPNNDKKLQDYLSKKTSEELEAHLAESKLCLELWKRKKLKKKIVSIRRHPAFEMDIKVTSEKYQYTDYPSISGPQRLINYLEAIISEWEKSDQTQSINEFLTERRTRFEKYIHDNYCEDWERIWIIFH